MTRSYLAKAGSVMILLLIVVLAYLFMAPLFASARTAAAHSHTQGYLKEIGRLANVYLAEHADTFPKTEDFRKWLPNTPRVPEDAPEVEENLEFNKHLCSKSTSEIQNVSKTVMFFTRNYRRSDLLYVVCVDGMTHAVPLDKITDYVWNL